LCCAAPSLLGEQSAEEWRGPVPPCPRLCGKWTATPVSLDGEGVLDFPADTSEENEIVTEAMRSPSAPRREVPINRGERRCYNPH
jgi:hypothetical protein